jgi:hypothetical protein
MESKVTKKVLNLLKIDEEYYGGIGRQFLSNSDIGTLLCNPAMFGVPQGDNKAFLMGRYFHCKMLEPEKVGNYLIVDASSRNTKIYKEFVQKINSHSLCLKESKKMLTGGVIPCLVTLISMR